MPYLWPPGCERVDSVFIRQTRTQARQPSFQRLLMHGVTSQDEKMFEKNVHSPTNRKIVK